MSWVENGDDCAINGAQELHLKNELHLIMTDRSQWIRDKSCLLTNCDLTITIHATLSPLAKYLVKIGLMTVTKHA